MEHQDWVQFNFCVLCNTCEDMMLCSVRLFPRSKFTYFLQRIIFWWHNVDYAHMKLSFFTNSCFLVASTRTWLCEYGKKSVSLATRHWYNCYCESDGAVVTHGIRGFISVGGGVRLSILCGGPRGQKADPELGMWNTGLGLIGQHNSGSFTGGTRLKQ